MGELNTAYQPIHRQPHKNPSERNTPAGVGASMYRLLFCPWQLNDRLNGILRHDLRRGTSEATPLKRGRNAIRESGKAGWRQIAVTWTEPNHHDGTLPSTNLNTGCDAKIGVMCRHYMGEVSSRSVKIDVTSAIWKQDDGKNGPICRHCLDGASGVTAELPSCAVTFAWHHMWCHFCPFE